MDCRETPPPAHYEHCRPPKPRFINLTAGNCPPWDDISIQQVTFDVCCMFLTRESLECSKEETARAEGERLMTHQGISILGAHLSAFM